MNTPICDFVNEYVRKHALRLHMPGHKGIRVTGPEAFDITEINGADVLYHAEGIIKESQTNAAKLFGTEKTIYSTEGSSLCIRAMLYLVKLLAARHGNRPMVLAARNAHKTFITAAALLDIDVKWLHSKDSSIISCNFDLAELENMISKENPTAVYITSPDYLGNIMDICAISELCHKYKSILMVDNAHGAYLKFLPESRHPIDLGADMCCDSAHKTLPVLTGGAYLHIAKTAPEILKTQAEKALSLFASTSPSYLILQALDKINPLLEVDFPLQLADAKDKIDELKKNLTVCGYTIIGNEPLKMTILTKDFGYTGAELAGILEQKNIVCEFADPDFLVMMFSPGMSNEEFAYLEKTMRSIPRKAKITEQAPILNHAKPIIRPHDALMALSEKIDVRDAEGKILASAEVTCPPAIPIVVCGEEINESAIKCFEYYGIDTCYTVLNDGKREATEK